MACSPVTSEMEYAKMKLRTGIATGDQESSKQRQIRFHNKNMILKDSSNELVTYAI